MVSAARAGVRGSFGFELEPAGRIPSTSTSTAAPGSRGDAWEETAGADTLGNNGGKVSPPSAAGLVWRRLRYELRTTARELSPTVGVQKCGRVRVRLGPVEVRLRGPKPGTWAGSGARRASFSGVHHCHSVWECPVCMQGVSMARGEELRGLLRKHRAAGGEAYMLTLTLPHDAGDELEPMRRHVAQAWRFCQTGAPWRRLKDRLRILGTVRALEVKVGPNGWHPHLHVLLVLERPLEPAVREELVAWVYRRWAERISRPNKDTGKAYRRPSPEHGVTLTVSYDDTYITKLGLADELAKASFKDRGELHRTPLQLLHDVHRFRDPYDVARWREYAVAMHGARQLTYAKGLRARYNLPAEQTDAELGEALERGPALVGATIDAQAWDELVAKDVRLQLRILAVVEREDTGEARQWAVQCLLDHARGLAPPPF